MSGPAPPPCSESRAAESALAAASTRGLQPSGLISTGSGFGAGLPPLEVYLQRLGVAQPLLRSISRQKLYYVCTQ